VSRVHESCGPWERGWPMVHLGPKAVLQQGNARVGSCGRLRVRKLTAVGGKGRGADRGPNRGWHGVAERRWRSVLVGAATRAQRKRVGLASRAAHRGRDKGTSYRTREAGDEWSRNGVNG
jgi:hypothetical protein